MRRGWEKLNSSYILYQIFQALRWAGKKEVKEIIPGFTILSPTNGQNIDVDEANEIEIQLKTKDIIITREAENKNGKNGQGGT